MKETLEVIFTWPSGRKEVRYRAEKGTEAHDKLLLQVIYLMESGEGNTPYSFRYVTV